MSREKYFSSEENPHYTHEVMYSSDFPDGTKRKRYSSSNSSSSNINIDIQSITNEEIDSYFEDYDIEQIDDIDALTPEEIDNLFNT